MPHILPPPISENELYERVKKNLRYLRKEVLYQQGFSTLDIARVLNSSSNNLKRIEDDLRGTIDAFIVLLNFYGRAGVDLNHFFLTDLWEGDHSGHGVGGERKYELGTQLEVTSAAMFYKNIQYVRKGFLKGAGVTTKHLEDITGVDAVKILGVEKGGKGRITTAVSLIHYYIRKGFQINTMLTSDLSAY